MEVDELSPYELLRLKRVEENRKVLKELGLLESDKPPIVRKTVKKPLVPKRKTIETNGIKNIKLDIPRRSIRTRNSSKLSELILKENDFESDNSVLDLSDKESSESSLSVKIKRPNTYGAIEGIPVGTVWRTRMECSADGVHRPTVAGIQGGKDGAYSIALSGGYEDDLDFGEGFTYTGSGGRDLKGTAAKPKNLRTAPQSKDQNLENVNASLAASVESKLPIRVIRGYKLPSVYAPDEGYRYDGLYTVEKYWFTTGISGFKVVKFALKRLKDQEPPPWTVIEEQTQNIDEDTSEYNNPSEKTNKVKSPRKNTISNNGTKTELCCETTLQISPTGSKISHPTMLNSLHNGLNSPEKKEEKTIKNSPSPKGSMKTRSLRNSPGVLNILHENELSAKGKEVDSRGKVLKNSSKAPSIENNSLTNCINETDCEKHFSSHENTSKISKHFKTSSETSVGDTDTLHSNVANDKQKICDHFRTEDKGQESDANCSHSRPKSFSVLPGQTTILKYFKPPNYCSDVENSPSDKPNNNERCLKNKILNNKEVTAKSLRGNKRPSLYMDNNLMPHSSPSPQKSMKIMEENLTKDNKADSKNLLHKTLLLKEKLESQRKRSIPKPSLLISPVKKQKDINTKRGNFEDNQVSHNELLQEAKLEHLNKKRHIKSAVLRSPRKKQKIQDINTERGNYSTGKFEDTQVSHNKLQREKVNVNKTFYSLDIRDIDLIKASCSVNCKNIHLRQFYLKSTKLSTSDVLNFTGWDADSDSYLEGFTNTDIEKCAFKKFKYISFLRNIKSVEIESLLNNDDSLDDWLGWDLIIPSSSIVVNGFLIEKYSNK